jgi:hypothetical protein
MYKSIFVSFVNSKIKNVYLVDLVAFIRYEESNTVTFSTKNILHI